MSLMAAIGHIPSIDITLDARFCHLTLKGEDGVGTIPMSNVSVFRLSVMRHEIFPHDTLQIPHQLVRLSLNLNHSHIVGVDGNEQFRFGPLGQALRATADTLQTLTLGIGHMNFVDSTFVYF